MCQRSTCSVRGIFVDIRRGTLEERYHTSYHVRKLKKWQWLIVSMQHLVEISEENRSLCLWKGVEFQTWRSQDVSKETLSDLVRKNVAQFSDKFFHFQYAAWKMCKGALNNHSMLKLHFFTISTHTFAMYCKNLSHQYYATNQESKPHILS